MFKIPNPRHGCKDWPYGNIMCYHGVIYEGLGISHDGVRYEDECKECAPFVKNYVRLASDLGLSLPAQIRIGMGIENLRAWKEQPIIADCFVIDHFVVS